MTVRFAYQDILFLTVKNECHMMAIFDNEVNGLRLPVTPNKKHAWGELCEWQLAMKNNLLVNQSNLSLLSIIGIEQPDAFMITHAY